MGDAFNPWMITFLFEVNPVLFDQKQFSNFAQQKDMNEMTKHDLNSVHFVRMQVLYSYENMSKKFMKQIYCA